MDNIYTKYYEVAFPADPKRNDVWKAIVHFLQPWCPSGGSVLELACGYGNFINNFNAAKKYAVDINDISRKCLNADVTFLQGSAEKIPRLSAGSMDLIFASHLLEHLELNQAHLVLQEAFRLLKPGGKLILLQPNYYYSYRTYFEDYTHRTVFDHRSLGDFVKAHDFEVLKLWKKILPGSMGSMKIPIPFLQTVVALYLRCPIRPMASQMLLIAQKPK